MYRRCPFCGQDMAATLEAGGIFFVECMGCHVRTGEKESYDDALMAWNRRHGGTEIQKIIDLAEADRGSYAIDRLAEIAELAREAIMVQQGLPLERTGPVQEEL